MSRATQVLPILKQDSFLIDSHCHLDMDAYTGDLSAVLQRSRENGIAGVVTIGIDLASSYAAVNLAREHPMVRAAVGIHPHDAGGAAAENIEEIGLLAGNNRDLVVGYGEIGLDYVKMHTEPQKQRSMFRAQLRVARELGLPVIIHDREAHEDCLQIIREEGPFPHGGIMHCFSGNLDFARNVIECNLHISIPGIVTFKNARDLQEVAASIPLDRMLLETDGPFLAPVPYRGKRNEPYYTLYTAATIAELRQTTIDEIAMHTSTNASRLFGYNFIEAQSGVTS